MYLYLGEDRVVRHSDIIGIFDLENMPASSPTQQFLSHAEKKGEVINVSFELPRSFILCTHPDRKDPFVYISQISAATLRKRAQLQSGCRRPGREEFEIE